jgi:tricorn protease
MTRRILRLSLLVVALAVTPAALHADEVRYLRHPHTSHGMIAFSYHGDIWLAQADGSGARRLTSHVARDIFPRFSPDGRWVAFTSNRMGNNDVYVVPVTGGEPRQLTWHGGDDTGLYWTPDGRGIVFATSRSPHPFLSPLYVVPVDGGLPVPLDMDTGRNGMIRQDGGMVAFNRIAFNYGRKGYRGANAADLWVQDTRTKEIRQLTNTDMQRFREYGHEASPMWGADGMVYYASDRDGAFNIWRVSAAGGEPQQVTRHTRDGVAFPAISPDGRTIIYEHDFGLWAVDVPGGQPRRIAVELAYDARDNMVEWITTQNRADGFAPSPNGDFVAVDLRGEIFIVPSEPDYGEKTQVTRSAWRDRNQEYSPNGRLLAYITDESGDEEIWVHEVATGQRRQLTRHESVKSSYTWSPDSRRIAFVAANRLLEVDVATGRTTELAFNRAGGYGGVSWSGDGRWLVYHRGDDDLVTDVYLFEIATRRETNVTRNPWRDANPTLTSDGRTIVFTSNRDGTTHLYALPLARLAEDPDDPLVRAARRAARADTSAARPGAELALQLDTAGIGRRPIQLTRGSNGVGTYFLSRDGRTIFFTSSDNDGAGLFSIGIDGRDRRRVAAGTFPGLTPTVDRRFVFFRQTSAGAQGDEVHRMNLSNQRRERIPFTFQVMVDQRAEYEQILEESWRVMKYRFYDENMHGVNWDSVKGVYRALLPSVGTYEDLHDLANRMIGELNASHTGVSGSPSRPMPRAYTTRYPGFELEPADGRYRISHIYRDGPADREWLGLSVGDYVLAIDGQELRAGDNFWRLLNHTLNDYVAVRVARSANGSGARDVRIRTVGALGDLQYEEWVARNREFVERESGGRIAYVHIRSMNQPSLERFRNEISRFWNAQGIVVDIRYNGGGNIDQELIDILERRPYEYWNNRWSAPQAGRRPRQAIAGPKVMLINWRSASDSEVTPQAFRDLELGRLVGNPTAGAVIATGSYSLIHGGSIRTPGSLVVTYDPTQPDNRGINLENFGVAPDVWARNSPDDELRGFDRELKAAVDEALRMLREGRWQFIEPANGSHEDTKENGEDTKERTGR